MRRRLAPLLVAGFLTLAPAMARADAPGRFCPDLQGELIRGGGDASGMIVIESGSGRALCQRAAQAQRPLASNMKLFTTSTALSRLGPDFRIPTRVFSYGTLDSNGVLHGSLYLKGGGDPTLGIPAFYDRFLNGLGTDLLDLVPQIRAAGIRSVTGRLYADDTIFDQLARRSRLRLCDQPLYRPPLGPCLRFRLRQPERHELRRRTGKARRLDPGSIASRNRGLRLTPGGAPGNAAGR